MAENYQFERSSVALDGTNFVTLVPAPPEGVSYRVFYINGRNDSGAAKIIGGIINSVASGIYQCFSATAANLNCYITQQQVFALAEYPTIAVLDDTDQTLQIQLLTGTGTDVISACYEIVDQTGPRTFRNAFATLTGATSVELIPAPTPETVHRVLNVNGVNVSGGNRIMYLTVGDTPPPNVVGQLAAVNNGAWRPYYLTNQSPFPPIILSGTSDYLSIVLNGTGTSNVFAAYEVLDRRVV
jgi:hypothetical protein